MTPIRHAGRFAVSVLAVALAASLAGCAATGAPPAAPTPTSTPSPTSESVDPLTTVTTIVARGDAVELHDGSGAVVERFEYTDAPTEALEALAVVFDRDPAIEEREAVSFHTPPSVLHSWGALTVDERLYPEDANEKHEASGLAMPDFFVIFDGAEAEGIRLTTVSGEVVGDRFDTIEVSQDPAEGTCVGPAVDPVGARNSELEELQVGVALSDLLVDESTQATTEVDVVTYIMAPIAIGQGCV